MFPVLEPAVIRTTARSDNKGHGLGNCGIDVLLVTVKVKTQRQTLSLINLQLTQSVIQLSNAYIIV